MGDWNLGSVGAETLLLVEGVPDSISGALPRIADRQREKVQQYTGVVIGSNAIAIKFQEAILQLTISKTASDMQSFGIDAKKSSLGKFSVDLGADSNLQVVAQNSAKAAQVELQCIGRRVDFFKANG